MEPSLPFALVGPVIIRLKCICCLRSFGMQQNYDKHVRQSNGRCTGSIPITTEFKILDSGRFAEVSTAAANPPSASPPSSRVPNNLFVHGFTQGLPFKTVEQTIAKYILDDEDLDTFVSLFTPLIQDHVHFEPTMCELIDRYKNPPAVHEQSLQTILLMGEKWLFERARHEVSVIPGNYRASLLQFDSQDMGEVSQNLTYNFRHREETLLPELKYLLSFLWRSQLPFLLPFRDTCNVDDPYFVARLLSTCFHEQTPSVFRHPSIIQFALARLFRKSSLDNALTMVGAGQNASVCAAILSLLRSAICSLICSVPSQVDVFAALRFTAFS